MTNRVSIIHPRVEELGGLSPSSSSPLRRRSSVAHKSPITSLVENDDEAERLARRLEKNQPQANDRRRSLGLGFVSQMSHPQLTEKVQQCIQLCAQNKINTKNAFALQMIDFMTYMIKKRDQNMNDLQVASTSLDVSTKIYGLRVDGIHTDILKMSGGLDKQDKNDGKEDNEAIDENGDAPEESEAASQARDRAKKKRKCKQKIISSAESLRGPIETMNPTPIMMRTGDTQTTDMLYMATIPYHVNRGVYLHLYNEVVLDTVNPEKQDNSLPISYPRINNLDHLETCSSLANFEILDWSVDDEKEELSPVEPVPVENGFQFDLDASLAAEDEPSNTGMNYFDIQDDESVEGCERVAQPAANIVDFRDVLRTSSRKENFEYSYFQDNMDIQWAGPSHWKIRHPSKNLAGSRIVGRCVQEPIKRRKELIMAYNNEADTFTNTKFDIAKGNRVKLQAKTAKNGWTEEKLTLPQDMHYSISQTCKFYLRNEVFLKFANEDDVNATHVSDDIGNYDYNNEHDTTDYCPNIGCEDQLETAEGIVNNGGDFDENLGACTQAFTGNNLVELPKMTNEIILPFSQRAKKIDMRQLKRCIWKNLTSAGIVDKENMNVGERTVAENREKIDGTVVFSSIFEELPKTLSKNNIEALSLPIAFISLLHLANEKTLQIDAFDDKSDLYVRQG